MGKMYPLNDGYKIELPVPQETPGQLGEAQTAVEAADAGGGPNNLGHSIKGASANPTGN